MMEEQTLLVMGRAEIDTRSPFRSVKEAVLLFGEKVLVGEIYAHKLKEMRGGAGESGQNQSKMAALTAELEETKQSLQKAREEAELMRNYVQILKDELEQTKRELKWLKAKEREMVMKKKPIIEDPEIEELKFVENTTQVDMMRKKMIKNSQSVDFDDDDDYDDHNGFGKRRMVKFASPPSLAKIIVTKEEMLEKHSSTKKTLKMKKSLVPVFGWLFSRKKGINQDNQSPKI